MGSPPFDQKTGVATGRRQHKPVTVVLDGADADQFRQAMRTSQRIDELTVELVRPAGPGQVEHYRNITLTNGTVSNVRLKVPRAGKGRGDRNEETIVSFTFQKIEITNVVGKKASEDDWTQ